MDVPFVSGEVRVQVCICDFLLRSVCEDFGGDGAMLHLVLEKNRFADRCSIPANPELPTSARWGQI